MKMMHPILACALIHTTLFNFVDKVNYTFQHDPIDAVIPCHWKGAHKLDAVINSIKKNVHNIRRIIIVSSKQFSEKAEWFDERQYPFNQKTIALEIFDGNEKKAQEFLDKPRTRVHWIYQQLLKLYAPLVIPEISSNVLLVDSDTLFLRPITFTNPKTGAGLLACATEYHRPYFEHAARLIPGFKRLYNCSGIVHHMLLQRPILNDLFMIIEQEHNMEPWKALCKCHKICSKKIFKKRRKCRSLGFCTKKMDSCDSFLVSKLVECSHKSLE